MGASQYKEDVSVQLCPSVRCWFSPKKIDNGGKSIQGRCVSTTMTLGMHTTMPLGALLVSPKKIDNGDKSTQGRCVSTTMPLGVSTTMPLVAMLVFRLKR